LENFGAGLSQALPPLFLKFQLRFFKEFLAVEGVARHGCSFDTVLTEDTQRSGLTQQRHTSKALRITVAAQTGCPARACVIP